jgi:hypothetical protein
MACKRDVRCFHASQCYDAIDHEATAGLIANETIASRSLVQLSRTAIAGAEAWWQSFSRPFLHYPGRGYLRRTAVHGRTVQRPLLPCRPDPTASAANCQVRLGQRRQLARHGKS